VARKLLQALVFRGSCKKRVQEYILKDEGKKKNEETAGGRKVINGLGSKEN